MLDSATYLTAFHREAVALAVAAQRGLDAPVPSCPGWTVATLLTHLTGLYAESVKLVEGRPNEPAALVKSYDDLGLPLEFKNWFEAEKEDLGALPPGLPALFETTVADLEKVLWSVEPDEPVWSWWPADQSARFRQRRLAQETAIHRWDAQLAHGSPAPIEPELAADGIDEHFVVLLPGSHTWSGSPRQGSGETYHFHRTDGPGEWLLRFAPDGPVCTREHATGDVALRGSASDLLLFLWQRIPVKRLEVFGDVALVTRYFELAPPG
jgi:uncharacterized protein (TIGR03083 family)